MKSITLFIFAHGKDIKYKHLKKYNFSKNIKIHNIPLSNIKIANCGSGDCETFTITNTTYTKLCKNIITKYKNDKNKHYKIKKFLKLNYNNFISSIKLTKLGKIILQNKFNLNKNNFIKDYHPLNERTYKYDKITITYLLFLIINNLIFYKQKKNFNIFNFLNYYPIIIKEINLHKTPITVIQTSDYKNINNIMNLNKFKYDCNYLKIIENFNKNNCFKLSDIIYICKLLNYTDINVYELSCRNITLNKNKINEINENELIK